VALAWTTPFVWDLYARKKQFKLRFRNLTGTGTAAQIGSRIILIAM
jgi:hypothetical protein